MRRRLAALSGCGDMRPEARPLGPDRRRTVTTFCRAFGVSSAAENQCSAASALQCSAASAMLHRLCKQSFDPRRQCLLRPGSTICVIIAAHGWHADHQGHPCQVWEQCADLRWPSDR